MPLLLYWCIYSLASCLKIINPVSSCAHCAARPASPHLVSYTPSQAFVFPQDLALSRHSGQCGFWKLIPCISEETFCPYQPPHSTQGQTQGGQATRRKDSSPLPCSIPSAFLKFPKGLSTHNIHLPSGVTAHVSRVHILSWDHLSRHLPPSALFMGPGGGKKPSETPASTSRLWLSGHVLTSLSFHFPSFVN